MLRNFKAHNLKVVGSNPTPATKTLAVKRGFLLMVQSETPLPALCALLVADLSRIGVPAKPSHCLGFSLLQQRPQSP